MDEFLKESGKFLKHRSGLCKMLADLEGRGPYEELTDIFGGEREILLAVLIQNALHPKNSDRTDAIKADKYAEIETLEQARAFLADLVKVNFTNSLRTAESEVHSAFSKMAAASDVKMLVNAPDVFIAAACLSDKQFYEGRGDRTTYFDTILELAPTGIPDLGRKLKLVTSNEFMGLKLYNDKICNP